MVTLGEVRELEQKWAAKPNEISAYAVGRLRTDLYVALEKEQGLTSVLQVQDLRDDVTLGKEAEKLYRKLREFLAQCRCL